MSCVSDLVIGASQKIGCSSGMAERAATSLAGGFTGARVGGRDLVVGAGSSLVEEGDEGEWSRFFFFESWRLRCLPGIRRNFQDFRRSLARLGLFQLCPLNLVPRVVGYYQWTII